MGPKAIPDVIDVDWDAVDDARQAAEGIEFTHRGQSFSLQLVNGHLQPVPIAPDHPALDHQPYQRASDALSQAFQEEARTALSERYRVRTEIDAQYQDVPLGKGLASIEKFRADHGYRKSRRVARDDNRQALSQLRQDYTAQVEAYLTSLRDEHTLDLAIQANQRSLEREESLTQQRFVGERARIEHVQDYDDGREERVAKASHERQLLNVRTANAHEARMAESETSGKVHVIEASGTIEVEKERLRLQVEEARQRRTDEDLARQEEREDQRVRDERVHELIKRRQDLAKMIPIWQQQLEVLKATTPEEIAQAAARAYIAFNEAFVEWSAVSSPEELIRKAPHIDELATTAVARTLEGMTYQGRSPNGTHDKRGE